MTESEKPKWYAGGTPCDCGGLAVFSLFEKAEMAAIIEQSDDGGDAMMETVCQNCGKKKTYPLPSLSKFAIYKDGRTVRMGAMNESIDIS